MGAFETDVFVLGGGPAGLATAIACRRAGLRVVLADAEYPPIDKACGEGLMPDSLLAASALGVEIPAESGRPFSGIKFWGGDRAVDALFPTGAGLGIRRTVLQPLLVEYASKAGVDLLWGCPVTGLDENTVSVGRERLKARWIVGADGTQSSIRRWAGMNSFWRDSQRYSYRRHYRTAPWSDYVEVYWGERCQFYVTPVGEREVCVALMTKDSYQRVAEALARFPLLAKRLEGIEPATPERGALAATRIVRRVTRRNVALIGDASGTVDPITGEGLCLAFKHAAALADALVRSDLSLYDRAHARLTRRPRFMADSMLLMDRFSFVQSRTLAAFEAKPLLFANLLSMHVGQLNAVRFAATAAGLGWKVVTA
jgi:menaquinone-9 beta-reductase